MLPLSSFWLQTFVCVSPRTCSVAAVATADIPNISAWRLNKTEEQELKDRVQRGEVEKDVKREIQTRKAVACEQRKKAALAISAKPSAPAQPKRKAKKDADPAAAAASPDTDPTNSAYYAQLEADVKTILQEFPGIEKEKPLPLSDSETDRSKTGVQEPYDLTKGKVALELHGVYRCSIPLFWIQISSSPTPGIPMSRRRVMDMSEFYFPAGKPQFLTGRMVELMVNKESLSNQPQNLQMISPEEIAHSLVAACALCIRRLRY